MLRVAAGEFSARGLQVDALAATALAHGAATSGSDAEAASSAADEEDGELALVAVARSQLEGNRWGGGVALLDGGSLEQLCALQLDAGVGALAWCGRERDVLACACDDGDVRLLRLSTDVDFALVPLVGARVENAGEDADASAGEDGWGHDDVVTGLSASAADKTKLASCSWDLTVKLWEIDASASHVATFEGHTDLVWGVAMHPTTAPTLASAAQDRTVVVWDSRRPHAASMLFKTKTPAFAVDWHPRKDYVCAVGLEDGTVLTYDTRAPKQPLNQLAVHGGAIHTVKYSSYHEDLLATGSDDATVALITDSCTPNAKVAEVSSSPTTSPEHAAHSDYVRGLTWYAQRDPIASDRRRPLALLATGSWDKMVRAWRSDEFAYQSLLERAL